VEFVMAVRVKKLHPALKHGGYSAIRLLPGEDRAAFEKLHQDLIVELRPDGPLESDSVAAIAHLIWRKQHLGTFRIAEFAHARYSQIRSEKVPSETPPPQIFDLPLGFDPTWVPPDPAEVKAGAEAAKTQARNELGDYYNLIEMGETATIPQMNNEFDLVERLDGLIDKHLKRLLFLKGLKSLSSTASSAPLPRIPRSQKAA